MAVVAKFAALRRLSQLTIPASLYVRRYAADAVASPSPSSPGSSSRLVADRVVDVTAIDPEGIRHPVRALTGHTLLQALKNGGLIERECHRLEDIYACMGECRVMVASEWLDKLPPRAEDEYDTLTRSKPTHKGPVDEHDRLGCQIVLTPELRGMVVAVPEPQPWDIP